MEMNDPFQEGSLVPIQADQQKERPMEEEEQYLSPETVPENHQPQPPEDRPSQPIDATNGVLTLKLSGDNFQLEVVQAPKLRLRPLSDLLLSEDASNNFNPETFLIEDGPIWPEYGEESSTGYQFGFGDSLTPFLSPLVPQKTSFLPQQSSSPTTSVAVTNSNEQRPRPPKPPPRRAPPPLPVNPAHPKSDLKPPKAPEIYISANKKAGTATLRWSLRSGKAFETVSTFEILSFHYNEAMTNKNWEVIDKPKAINLSMNVDLKLNRNARYHFAIRAVDKRGRAGPFSAIKQVAL